MLCELPEELAYKIYQVATPQRKRALYATSSGIRKVVQARSTACTTDMSLHTWPVIPASFVCLSALRVVCPWESVVALFLHPLLAEVLPHRPFSVFFRSREALISHDPYCIRGVRSLQFKASQPSHRLMALRFLRLCRGMRVIDLRFEDLSGQDDQMEFVIPRLPQLVTMTMRWGGLLGLNLTKVLPRLRTLCLHAEWIEDNLQLPPTLRVLEIRTVRAARIRIAAMLFLEHLQIVNVDLQLALTDTTLPRLEHLYLTNSTMQSAGPLALAAAIDGHRCLEWVEVLCHPEAPVELDGWRDFQEILGAEGSCDEAVSLTVRRVVS